MVAQRSAAAEAADLLAASLTPDGLQPSDVLDGYRSWESGSGPVFWPAADRDLPVLGVGAPPPDVADPAQALSALLPGWQPASAWATSTAGVTLGGWRFASVQRDVARPGGVYLTALAVLLAGAGTQQVVWGLGNPARSVLNGGALVRLLHSLPPAGEVHGAALAGTWRNSSGYGVAEYEFAADGRFRRGLASDVTFGLQETTTGSTRTGGYRIVAGTLELTDDGGVRTYLGRLYDEYGYGAETPVHTLGLMPADTGDEVGYARVAG
jgi:hypothetical protein